MNYRHIYHAGNFADIIKHLILYAILENLQKKPKPFAVLDGFAGIGIYDLASVQSLKTLESSSGIKQFIERAIDIASIPALLSSLLKLITTIGREDLYPGSPLIIKGFLRPNDRLIACELHPADLEDLRKLLQFNRNINVHNLDAYLSIKAFLPFQENRGLIFFDPPFEIRNEFDKLIAALKVIKLRATNICTLIWYPIKDDRLVDDFYANCKLVGFKEILKIEFQLLSSIKNMDRCGLLIINPPNIKQMLEENFSYIKQEIYNEEAEFGVNYL